jgi:hypothetical protein
VKARIIASLILGAPSLAAIYGSAASLIEIAAEERLSNPRVLPFCLDILAVGIVVSAVFCGHDDRLSRITLGGLWSVGDAPGRRGVAPGPAGLGGPRPTPGRRHARDGDDPAPLAPGGAPRRCTDGRTR